MTNRNSKHKSRSFRTIAYVYVLIVLFSLFSVATYTWFSLSRNPKVSDLALYVNAPKGLEFSTDPEADEWELQLDYLKLVGETAPLRPVTWSARDNRFYAVTYGFDGRINDIKEPLSDDRNANQNNADGHYIKGVFYARADQKVSVSLTSAVEVKEGLAGAGTYVIGEPVWNPETISHDNGGNGAELAIRIGILVEKTDLKGNLKDDAPVFYIYEPNSDKHISGTEGYIPTESVDKTPSLVDDKYIIKQTTSSWTESTPVEKDVVVRTMGEFTTDTKLFVLNSDELAKISLYVWIEGQDVDCTNAIGHNAVISANVQFSAAGDGQSGMVPIDGIYPGNNGDDDYRDNNDDKKEHNDRD